MTDFDQLIKNKADQAQYAYKPSAWKSFAKHSGFKVGLSGWQIAVATIATVAVVGGAVWGILSATHRQPANTPQNTTESTVAVIDSANHTETDEPTLVNEPTPAPTKQTPQKPTEAIVVQETVTETPVEKEPAKPRKTTTRPWGKPVLINVDTITQLEATDEELRNGHSRLY